MTNPTFWWWSGLCAVAIFNVTAWCASARLLGKRRTALPPDASVRRNRLLLLSAIYVAGCAFRSLLPMIDVPRLCLHETVFSRIVIGRTVATVAELSFAGQWVLLLRELGGHGGKQPARTAATAVLVMIVFAEVLSWLAVILRNNLFHALENSLWTLAAIVAVAGAAASWRRISAAGRRFVAAAVVCGGAYVAFMLSVDVPMYLDRWLVDLQTGGSARSWSSGWQSLIATCTVVWDWPVWREDALWLTLYFSLAVWISIALPHTPWLGTANRQPAGS